MSKHLVSALVAVAAVGLGVYLYLSSSAAGSSSEEEPKPKPSAAAPSEPAPYAAPAPAAVEVATPPAPALRNHAFVFIKPHANTQATRELVVLSFADYSYAMLCSPLLSSPRSRPRALTCRRTAS